MIGAGLFTAAATAAALGLRALRFRGGGGSERRERGKTERVGTKREQRALTRLRGGGDAGGGEEEAEGEGTGAKAIPTLHTLAARAFMLAHPVPMDVSMPWEFSPRRETTWVEPNPHNSLERTEDEHAAGRTERIEQGLRLMSKKTGRAMGFPEDLLYRQLQNPTTWADLREWAGDALDMGNYWKKAIIVWVELHRRVMCNEEEDRTIEAKNLIDIGQEAAWGDLTYVNEQGDRPNTPPSGWLREGLAEATGHVIWVGLGAKPRRWLVDTAIAAAELMRRRNRLGSTFRAIREVKCYRYGSEGIRMMSRWTGVYDHIASSATSLTWVRELGTKARLQGTRMDLDERKRPRGEARTHESATAEKKRFHTDSSTVGTPEHECNHDTGNDHEREEDRRPDTGGKRRLEEAEGEEMRMTADMTRAIFHTHSSIVDTTEDGQKNQEKTARAEGDATDTHPIDARMEGGGRGGSEGTRPASRPRSQALQQWGTLHTFFGDSTRHAEVMAGGQARDPPATGDEQPPEALAGARGRDPRLERIGERSEGSVVEATELGVRPLPKSGQRLLGVAGIRPLPKSGQRLLGVAGTQGDLAALSEADRSEVEIARSFGAGAGTGKGIAEELEALMVQLRTELLQGGVWLPIADATIEPGQVTMGGRFNPKITFQQSILHGRAPYDDESYEPGYGGKLQPLIQWTHALLKMHASWAQDHEADGNCQEEVESDALQHELGVAAKLMQMCLELQGDVVTFLYLVHDVLQDVMHTREADRVAAQRRAAQCGASARQRGQSWTRKWNSTRTGNGEFCGR